MRKKGGPAAVALAFGALPSPPAPHPFARRIAPPPYGLRSAPRRARLVAPFSAKNDLWPFSPRLSLPYGCTRHLVLRYALRERYPPRPACSVPPGRCPAPRPLPPRVLRPAPRYGGGLVPSALRATALRPLSPRGLAVVRSAGRGSKAVSRSPPRGLGGPGVGAPRLAVGYLLTSDGIRAASPPAASSLRSSLPPGAGELLASLAAPGAGFPENARRKYKRQADVAISLSLHFRASLPIWLIGQTACTWCARSSRPACPPLAS